MNAAGKSALDAAPATSGSRTTGPLTATDVRRVATLARLELDDGEVARMTVELAKILDYFAELDALDLTGVEPTAHAVADAVPLRDDVARDGLRRDEALAAAPATCSGAFSVPKVMDGD